MAISGALIRPKARQRRNLRHVLIEGFTCAHKSNVAGATLKISHHNFFDQGPILSFPLDRFIFAAAEVFAFDRW